MDWDTVLVDNYPKVKAAQTKEEFNKILLSITQKMGELKPVKHPFHPSDSEAINADFKWMEDTTIINSQLCDYLKRVKTNHKRFRNKYLKASDIDNPKLFGEKSYPEMAYPNEAYRFLSLARYWNIIDYYFTNKYLMDSNWNISLERTIPIFIQAKDTSEYYKAIQWLVSRTDDSHGFGINPPRGSFLDRKFYTPFRTFYANDSLVIVKIINDSICKKNDIRLGDVITKFDGNPVKEFWEDVRTHYSFSTESQAKYELGSVLVTPQKDAVTLEILRDGKQLTKTVSCLNARNYIMSFNDIKNYNKEYAKKHPSFAICTDTVSGKKYGYINMGVLQLKEVKNVFKQMKDIDYLIIDARNYPKMSAVYLTRKLMGVKKVVARYNAPDYSYPGYVKYYPQPYISAFCKRVGSHHKNYYKGKVIILVDHLTQSAAEYNVMQLQQVPNSVVIGTQTAGADGNVSPVTFPGNYKFCFTGLGWFYADGRQTQRIGIIPDIKVEYTIQTKVKQIDPIMQRALELIRTGK